MNQFIKNFQINLPLKPVITKKQPKNSSMSINSLLTKNQNPISAPKKINTDLIASTLNRKTSAKSEKVSINCDESIETKSTSSNIKKNKKVNKVGNSKIGIHKTKKKKIRFKYKKFRR